MGAHCCSVQKKPQVTETRVEAGAQPGLAVKDPVCGMDVDPADSAGSHEFAGKTYHFCSSHCLKKFREHPEQYADGEAKAEKAASASPALKDVIHTCPMHPEIRQAGPGSCPICGMALEPEEVSLEDDAPTPSSSTSPAGSRGRWR